MPIGKIESKGQLDRKLVYIRADGMPNSLESMVVCRRYLDIRLPGRVNRLPCLQSLDLYVNCLGHLARLKHNEVYIYTFCMLKRSELMKHFSPLPHISKV